MHPEILPSYFIGDARVDSTLRRLYADALRVDPVARAAATGRGLDEGAPAFYGAMKDAYMPVTPDLGMLLYALARATAAREAVEFGTSFGISAIWLAAALRENGGRLVTAELDDAKARRAALNLAEAGLADRVEIRTGPAQQTLAAGLPDTLDLVFLDGAKSLYLPVLQLVEPRLRRGALIVADNTDMPDARPFLDYTTRAASGYRAAALTTEALGARHPCRLLVRTG
ncbi:O-methyltransferase [Paraburkholderia ferrariae]|uniref:O-methyltransferase n=1 Tax=Paraburkholderia ferrariae TaxID=386056 RepID=UPI0007C6BAD6|nr:class I SAM-dependent methyltransferase [Paraburkholderia ferrariae]